MKILYVEDQLTANIPRLLRLFTPCLSAEQIEKLHAFETDPSGFGAGPEEIKHILEATASIDVAYRFPDALRKIVRQPEQYSLFLVDRNLSEQSYSHAEIQHIDPRYTAAVHAQYGEKDREGDYLLLKLALFSPVDVMAGFYFLTAYPARDELRSAHEIAHLIELGKFTEDNFIEKGNDTAFERLCTIVATAVNGGIHGADGRIVQYYQKTFAYCQSHDPEASLWMARKTAEAVCRQVFEQEVSDNSNAETSFDKFLEMFGKQRVVPRYVLIPLRTIQSYGNYGTHDQGADGGIITTEYAQPCLNALTTIVKWYLSEYRHVKDDAVFM